jgi:hypothetical protein
MGSGLFMLTGSVVRGKAIPLSAGSILAWGGGFTYTYEVSEKDRNTFFPFERILP